MGRIILAGGGDAEDSRPLDEQFARWTGETGRMLYIPVAMDRQGPDYAQCREWIEATFGPLGVTNITLWADLAGHTQDELNGFDSVYLGGGNTFHLLAELRGTGFGRLLEGYLTGGGSVYGGSAGAIVLGRDIMTCAHLDENRVGLTDTRGLDLVRGYSVWCHYQPDEDERIQAYIRQHQVPVLALTERAGVRVERDDLFACGYEPIFHFDARNKQQLP